MDYPRFDLVLLDLRVVGWKEFAGTGGNVCTEIMLYGRELRADRAIVIREAVESDGLRSSLPMGGMNYIRLGPYGEPVSEAQAQKLVSIVESTLSLPPYQPVNFYDELPVEMERFCHDLVESLNVPIAVFDDNDQIIFMNLAGLAKFHYVPQVAFRKDWRFLLSEKNNAAVISSFVDAVRHTIGAQIDLTCRTGEGEEFPALITGNRIFGLVQPYPVVLSIQDQTEHKVLEDQVFQLQKMESISRLAGGIAHDFNNILGAILGHASLLELTLDPETNEGKDVQKIIRATKQGADLAMQLLGFARGGKYNVKAFNLANVVDNTIGMFPVSFHENLSIEKQIEPDVANIEGDESQWKQVFANLLLNAKDAMPSGGRVIIGLRNVHARDIGPDVPTFDPHSHPGLHVEILVKDTGIGMPPEVRQRAFEPFFTTKEKGRGTGLGLPMVYGIIKNHGGQVLLTSEPGKGTEFRIYVPASSKEARQDEERIITTLGGDETILIVDDQISILEVAERSLKRLGYRTYTAQDGLEALEVFDKYASEISLVLADLIMPRMGGRDLFFELQKRSPRPRVLLMSGYSQESWAGELLNQGAKGFLPKPYDMDSLSRAVRQALDE